MQTQSHFLITAFAGKQLQQRGIPVRHKAWLIGSVIPDIPLALLTMGGTLYYRWFNPTVPAGEVHEQLHFQLFFSNPWWIASHNFFHSLVIGALLLSLGWWAWHKQKNWGLTLLWFAMATIFHTVIDIFTHHSDGPGQSRLNFQQWLKPPARIQSALKRTTQANLLQQVSRGRQAFQRLEPI